MKTQETHGCTFEIVFHRQDFIHNPAKELTGIKPNKCSMMQRKSGRISSAATC